MNSSGRSLIGLKGFVATTNRWPLSILYSSIYKLGIHYLSWRLRKEKAVKAFYVTGSAAINDQCYGISDVDFYIVIDAQSRSDAVILATIEMAISDAIALFPFLGPYAERQSAVVTIDERGRCDDLNFEYRSQTCAFTEVFAQANWTLPAKADDFPLAVLSELNLAIRGLVDGIRNQRTHLYFWKAKLRSLIICITNQTKATGLTGLIHLSEDEREMLKLLWSKSNSVLSMSYDEDIARTAYSLFWRLIDKAMDVHGIRQLPEQTVHYLRVAEEPITAKSVDTEDNRIKFSEGTVFRGSGVFLLDDLPQSFCVAELANASYEKAALVLRELHRLELDCLCYFGDFVVQLASGNIGVGNSIMAPFAFRKDSTNDTLSLKTIVVSRLLEHARAVQEEVNLRLSVLNSIHDPAKDSTNDLYMDASYSLSLRSTSPYLMFADDDYKIFRDMFDFYRLSQVSLNQIIVYRSVKDVVSDLSRQYPAQNEFLQILQTYYQRLKGPGEHTDKGLPANFFGYANKFFLSLITGGEMPEPDLLHLALSISLCVCTKDRPFLLKALLECLLHQSRKPDELVIIDSSSGDETYNVIKGFEGELPIRYFKHNSGSLAVLRNRALTESTKEIIAFTDDDCILETGWLANVERTFQRSERIGAVGGIVKLLRSGNNTAVEEFYDRYMGSAPKC